MFQCTGSQYCNPGQIANAAVTIDGNTDTVSSGGSPICVENNSSSPQGKFCWHFWGTNSSSHPNPVIFEYFICATNAYYQPDSSLMNNGAWLYADGVNIAGENYYYFQGTFGGITYNRYLEKVNKIIPIATDTRGDCNSCLNNGCTVQIYDVNGGLIYQKSGKNCNVNVQCDGCPDGTIQCSCNDYPGYCCLPCVTVESGIQNLIDLARSANK